MMKVLFCLSFLLSVRSSFVSWTEWKSSGKCERACDSEFGEMRLYRECQICEKSHQRMCKISSNTSLCLTHLDGSSEDTQKCFVAEECTGTGVYTGRWSEWKAFSECQQDSREKECKGVQFYTRDCLPSDKKSHNNFECSKYEDGFLYTRTFSCDKVKCSSTNTRNRFKKDENSGWNTWSKWEPECTIEQLYRCSITDVQQRNRTCKNDNLITECIKCYDIKRSKKEDPLNCESEIRTCNYKWLAPDKQHFCPNIDGGWGNWSEWSPCSITCKDQLNGTQMRFRTCSNPPKSGLKGKDCIGESIQFKECNSTHECIYIDYFSEWSEWRSNASCGHIELTKKRTCLVANTSLCIGPRWVSKKDFIKCELDRSLVDKIRSRLHNAPVNNYLKKEGDSVVLECDHTMMKLLHTSSTLFSIHWIFNSRPLKLDINRMTLENNDLIISSLIYEDSGSYLCLIRDSISNNATTIDFFSVSVQTQEPQILLDGVSQYYLNCSGALLTKTFKDITFGMNWTLVKPNGMRETISKDNKAIYTRIATTADYMCLYYNHFNKSKTWIMRYVRVKYEKAWFFIEYPYTCAILFLSTLAAFAYLSGYLMYKAEKLNYDIDYYTQSLLEELDLKVDKPP